jgi:signal-transduction protein with cAMP-binding, CBS, and nucleotidyltransferase domain
MTTEVIHAPMDASILQLAQLMAEYRVSCVVITQMDEEENPCPVGIVTERDIVQFQASQLDLATTKAQTVMSSPLFLLSPEDSLWTAHQEMKKRHIGRMVVSWNWGKGLGIVTQTSLLRIFDPMEMYGVIDNMQQTIQQLKEKPTISNLGEKSESLTSQSDLSADTHQDSQLVHICTTIKYLIDHLDLPKEEQRSHLQSVLDDLQPFLETKESAA